MAKAAATQGVMDVVALDGAITPERIERIARLHQDDRTLPPDKAGRAAKEAAIELEMSHNATLDTQWTHRQLAVAEHLAV